MVASDNPESPDERENAQLRTYTATFDGNQRPTAAVVEAVAAASGRDPCDIEPLYEVIDPDALDQLFATPMTPAPDSQSPSTERYLSFRFGGCEVTVYGTGMAVATVIDE